MDLKAILPPGNSSHAFLEDVKEKATTQQTLSKIKIHPKYSIVMLTRVTIHSDDRHHLFSDLKTSNLSLCPGDVIALGDLMEKMKLSIEKSVSNSDIAKNVSKSVGIQQKRPNKCNPEKPSAEDSEKKTLEDESIQRVLSSYGKKIPSSNELESKQKNLDKKKLKQVKRKSCIGIEKELDSNPNAKVAGKKSIDLPSLESLQDLESEMKVHESLDTFIRQTMDHKSYMSFTSRPDEKSIQRLIEHQQATNKYVKSWKVDVDICDGQVENANVEPLQVDTNKHLSRTKGGISILHQNLQTIKNSVPQVVAAFVATKIINPGKQSSSIDDLTDLSGWPLLSTSQAQLLKCEKCSREFFSSFNYRRHSRTHRRISHVDKEDLTLKRKNITTFWDKVNQMDAKQIFASSKKYVLEDLSGEAVVNNLIAFKGQNNSLTLPSTYMKAGQDLLDILANEQRTKFPLSSQQILSVLDEASEKTFLCFQGDVSKIGLEEKNLVASLGFIVEQALVKAWMADKDAEALRHQQELVKEEEAAQMKQKKSVAKKKKKKEKSRQKGLKERKVGATQLALSEENELVDDENPSPKIVEEDNSPTTSSTSMSSSGLENPLLGPLEIDINDQIQNANEKDRDHNICRDDGNLLNSKDISSTHVISREVISDGNRVQQNECDLAPSNSKGEKRCFNFLPSNTIKVEDLGGSGHILEQDQSVVEHHNRTPLRPYKEPLRIDYQDSYQKCGWISNPRFREGAQQNSYRLLQKPSIGMSYQSNNERGSNSIFGFYRNKSTSLRGTTPFLATQQWAKKVQSPITIDHVKDGQENESSQEHGTYTSKTVEDSAIEQIFLAQEIDTIGTNNKAKSKEFKFFEKKEVLPLGIPSIATVVANSGGISNIPTSSFNLNANSEDWPSLSNSHAAYYPKNVGTYSLNSYQYELNLRSIKKQSSDKRGGHQTGFESKVERSMILDIPPIRGSVNETSTESTTGNLQKGIMIGSVSVPLGNYVKPSEFRFGRSSCRISNFLPAQQSYTVVLAASPVGYTQDPMANTMGQQNMHKRICRREFKDSSNLQVIELYEGPGHYRVSSLKSAPSVNLNTKFMRGPTYLVGDQGERGILTKQTSWSGGSVRYLSQKIWRPIRLTCENIDPNPSDGIGIESSPIGTDEKIRAIIIGSEEKVDTSFQVACMQVQDMDINNVKECQTLATDSTEQVGKDNGALDFKSKKENVLENAKNCEIVVPDSDHVQQKTSEGAFVIKIASAKVYQTDIRHAMEQNEKDFQEMNNHTKKMDDKAYVEITLSHSNWIAEVVKFHLNRWNSSLKDLETIIDKCEEGHSELRTTKWVDFMDSLPSIATRSTLWKENFSDPEKISNNNDPIGTNNCSNLLDEQRENVQNIREESSRGSPIIHSTCEEKPQNLSCCESEPPCLVGSTIIGHVLGSQSFYNERQY